MHLHLLFYSNLSLKIALPKFSSRSSSNFRRCLAPSGPILFDPSIRRPVTEIQFGELGQITNELHFLILDAVFIFLTNHLQR